MVFIDPVASPAAPSSAQGRSQRGEFEAVVIAHNGKCANRLAAPSHAPAIARQLMQLRLSAHWVCMVGFESPVKAPFEGESQMQKQPVSIPHTMNSSPCSLDSGAFIQGSDELSWACSNTRKMQLEMGGLDVWTLISTREYGAANKVPQEAVPAAVEAKV